jgi:DNA-binding CsgD family transcriptional regulator
MHLSTQSAPPPESRPSARELFAGHAWRQAYAALATADESGELDGSELELLASTAFLIGRDQAGESALSRAHKAHASVGDFEAAARAACHLGFRLMWREPAHANGWLGRAARTLEDAGCDECAVHGYLMLFAGIRHAIEGNFDQAHVDFANALAVGRRFGSGDLILLARLGEGRAFIRRGQIAAGTRLLDEVMVAVTGDDLSPENVGIIYCVALDACDETFDVARAREWTEAFGRWCDSEPEIVPNRGDCLVRHAEIKQLRGEWTDAMTEVTRACDVLAGERASPAAGTAFYRLAELHRLRGEFSEAEAAYANASRHGREPQPGLALLRISQGQTAVAVGAIRRALDEAKSPARRAESLRACVDVSLAVGDVARARAAAEEFSDLAERIGAPLLRATAAQARGAVHLADGQARDALSSLRTASEIWRALDAPYEVARVRLVSARAHRLLGDPDTARLELAAARQVFEELGARPDAADADAVLDQLAGDDHPGANALTDREVEVLGLVATGRTNRSVADALGISEKTVARHVANIFGKLGLSTRAAATAYAHRRGLI